MKKFSILFLIALLTFSCTSQKNSEEFINKAEGRYLFNSNEILEIYFEDQIMFAKWRGKDKIELLKVNDSSFYMRDLNEKMLFVSKPKMHIKLEEKTEHDGVKYSFEKLKIGEKTASEYFNDKEYKKALLAFKAIKKNDSLDINIRERRINSLGYRLLRDNDLEEAIEMFKINAELYPNSSNVYDSLGDAYLKAKDTSKAKENYKKALGINPENRNAKRNLNRLTEK